jgi:hypothetical protein
MCVNVCVFQGIRNVRKVTIGSSTRQGKTNCHVIIQAEVPSCFGWAPEEDIYVPPVADPSEITARPNVRKKMQNPEIKEIKRGPLKKSKSAKPFAAMLRFVPECSLKIQTLCTLTPLLSWQERFFIVFSDRIEWWSSISLAVLNLPLLPKSPILSCLSGI